MEIELGSCHEVYPDFYLGKFNYVVKSNDLSGHTLWQ